MARQSQSWKDLERKTAHLLGGKRVYRGADFSESLPDVMHPTLGIECKYRSAAPSFYYDYMDILRPVEQYTVLYHGDRVAVKLSEFAKIMNGEVKSLLEYTFPIKKKLSVFLEKALTQAVKYDLNKTPIVVYKKKQYTDEIVYMRKSDFLSIYHNQILLKRSEELLNDKKAV